LAAYELALREAGRMTLADLLAPAAELAEAGFALNDGFVRKLTEAAADLGRFDPSAAIFLDAERRPWPVGHVLKQPDLARTYRAIAQNGIDWFYRGPFARDVTAWMSANGGLLGADDFANYRALPREPLVTRYRGHTIVGFPPPSSGGVHVAQTLNVLESFDLAGLERKDPALRQHVIAESLKLAFADRAFWLGDPDFTRVPRGLADEAYAAELAKRIRLDRALEVPSHGQPPHAETDVFPRAAKHTTHIAAADGEGNWVAITATVNTTFGSKVVIPGTGVVMNNQMDDFSLQPGVANAFGLVGAEANAVAPGKRPLSSMSPTVVIDGDLATGRPVLTVGAAGGPMIISAVVQVIVNRIGLGMSLDQALAEPRVHHQWRPDVLAVEREMPADVVARLEATGHRLDRRATVAVAQAAAVVERTGGLQAAHDPWVPGLAVHVAGAQSRPNGRGR
jgi:gamma-glutamyltranspeptidase/glutathione hydrolase